MRNWRASGADRTPFLDACEGEDLLLDRLLRGIAPAMLRRTRKRA
jgi:hypothetical protein